MEPLSLQSFCTKRLSITRGSKPKRLSLHTLAVRAQGHYRIAFISDPDGNVIELIQIRPESAIYRDTTWPAIAIDSL